MLQHNSPNVFVQTTAEQESDVHKDERAALRAQMLQCEAQRQLQRKQIRELQQELAKEREGRLKAESRLADERERLEEERRKLRRVHSECTKPFVVPALFDAFHKASDMAWELL